MYKSVKQYGNSKYPSHILSKLSKADKRCVIHQRVSFPWTTAMEVKYFENYSTVSTVFNLPL